MADQRTYPGASANGALRVFATLEIILSIIGMLVIWAEFGSTSSAYGYSTETNPVGVALAIAVLVQGILIAALFYALAGFGDNLIGVRSALESPPVPPTTAPGVEPKADLTSPTALQGESASADGISSSELSAELRRREILRKVEAGKLRRSLDNADTWRFVLRTGMPEVADGVLQWITSRDDARERLRDYMASLEREDAKTVLFGHLPDASNWLAARLTAVARDLDLMDFSRATELLRSTEGPARRRFLELCGAHCSSYGLPEIAAMREFADEIDRAFVPTPLHTRRVGLKRTETDFWKCACKKDVEARLDVCPTCGADRFGFKASEWGPQQTKRHLETRLEALNALIQNVGAPAASLG